jgi:hypothetical protein
MACGVSSRNSMIRNSLLHVDELDNKDLTPQHYSAGAHSKLLLSS